MFVTPNVVHVDGVKNVKTQNRRIEGRETCIYTQICWYTLHSLVASCKVCSKKVPNILHCLKAERPDRYWFMVRAPMKRYVLTNRVAIAPPLNIIDCIRPLRFRSLRCGPLLVASSSSNADSIGKTNCVCLYRVWTVVVPNFVRKNEPWQTLAVRGLQGGSKRIHGERTVSESLYTLILYAYLFMRRLIL